MVCVDNVISFPCLYHLSDYIELIEKKYSMAHELETFT